MFFVGLHHLFHFHGLQVERKLMRQPRFGVVELQRQLVQLEPAVTRFRLDAIPQGLHFLRRHRLETLRDGQILVQYFQAFHPGNRGGDRQAHGVAEGFLRADRPLPSPALHDR